MTAPVLFSLSGLRVYVAGHLGMVGQALLRRLAREDCEVLTATRKELDLTRQAETEEWFAANKPDAVFMAAARVGGIHANATYPADFIYDNLAISQNTAEAARRTGVKKFLYLGSSCIYPRQAPQPMREDALLSGPLEPTNQWYAIAKIAGLKLCAAYRRQHGADFISAQPTNLYGPGDNYDLKMSHVIPALVAKMHQAKIAKAAHVDVWGSGQPRREFMFVDDLADALVFLMTHYSDEAQVNVGTGQDVTIAELALLVKNVVGFEGPLRYDPSQPDGAPRKLLDVGFLKSLGWRSKVGLREGLEQTYTAFQQQQAKGNIDQRAGGGAASGGGQERGQ